MESRLQDVEEHILNVFDMSSNGCELCNLKQITKWWYEDDKWVICDCKTCKRPMIVYKQHTMFIPLLDWVNILSKVYEIFGNDIILRFKQRKIKNHFHIHIYKKEVYNSL